MKFVLYKDVEESFFSSREIKVSDDAKKIIDAVKEYKDRALTHYTEKYDDIYLTDFEVSKGEILNSFESIDEKVRTALMKSASVIGHISTWQHLQLKQKTISKQGITINQRIIPVDSAGCYIPGGKYPLPSSALMTGIPAKVAGVKNVIACSPPSYNGSIHPVTLAAMHIAGVDRVFKIGGAQAIAAMAYGTKTVPSVDLIVGPGNKYVNEAKKEVYGKVGIDFIAGPSELMIIADDSANPKFIASDLLAQAEHDIDSRPILVTSSRDLVDKVKEEINRQLENLKTEDIAKKTWNKNGYVIFVKNLEEAVEFANKYSPEHLQIMLEPKKAGALENRLTTGGSLFYGTASAVLGDYASGANHVLPTNRAGRYTGGLNVLKFLKFGTSQSVTENNELYDVAQILAEVEGLDAHARAAEMRKTS